MDLVYFDNLKCKKEFLKKKNGKKSFIISTPINIKNRIRYCVGTFRYLLNVGAEG